MEGLLNGVPVLVDLRQRLLGALDNIELRQKYLATRLPEWLHADRQRAADGLLFARILRGILGFTLLGGVGGALGDLAVSQPGTALPVVVALGCAVAGAVSFAILAVLGFVVLPEIVGEERKIRHGHGLPATLGRIADILAEAGCGAIWGGMCGLLLGALTWLADAAVGLPHDLTFAAAFAGAIGGLLLALLGAFFLIVVVRGQPPNHTACQWADLGPLPLLAFLGSRTAARRRFLHK